MAEAAPAIAGAGHGVNAVRGALRRVFSPQLPPLFARDPGKDDDVHPSVRPVRQ